MILEYIYMILEYDTLNIYDIRIYSIHYMKYKYLYTINMYIFIYTSINNRLKQKKQSLPE